MIHSINSIEQFNQIISSNDRVILKMTSPSCGPCKMLTPLFDQLANQLADTSGVTFASVSMESDETAAVFSHLNVATVPTLLVFVNGERSELRKNGALTKIQLMQFINSVTEL